MDKKSNKNEKEENTTPLITPSVQKIKQIAITFKENRKYDLHIGRDMITFKGREEKLIPRTWLAHPDFKQAANLFIVRGD